MRSKRQEISKYGYIIFASLIISSVFNYLYQVLMGNLLTRSEFGVLGVALSTFFIVAVLLQNSFTWSGTRLMASNLELSQKIFDATLIGNLALAALLSTAVLAIAKSSSLYSIGILISATLIVGGLLATVNAFLRAHKLFPKIALANIINSVTKLISSVALVVLGYGALGAFSGVFAGMAVSLVYLLSTVKNKVSIRFTLDLQILKKLLKESAFAAVIFTGLTTVINFNVIALKLINISNSVIGSFNAALTIARGIFFLTSALVLVIFSYTSSSDPNREIYAAKSIRYVILFILPLAVSMYVSPKQWLMLFFGLKYLESETVLRILATGIGLASLSFAVVSNLVAFEDYKLPAITVVAGVLIMIAFTIFDRTVVGVAEAVAVSAAFLAVSALIYYSTKYRIKVSLGDCIKVAAANTAFLAGLIGPRSRLTALAILGGTYTLYVLILAGMGVVDEGDIETILAPLPKSIRRKVSAFCRRSR